ncbi:DUF3298 and DUF4163 domain-containing protein [Mucilaginibacter pedocola]|uniref:DUF3298 domain-containing protein n=1 Tax=Mucilaginibacter pedocola TaxID=1792845 RepID=A0A1S9PLE8_9SPHI|nr:DUF3298 and DUF4163 domain-containing protein [Mucilaginibacter pedocola]OOQ61765.1 hypothetical protein BC343_01455 [Mucilaginibacter pedocola]
MTGMRGIWLGCVTLIALAGCEFGKPAKKVEPDSFTDTVGYEMKTIHDRAKDCGTRPDSTCTTATINYPLFKGQDALNDTLQSRLINLYVNGDEKPDSSLSAMVATYLTKYDEFKKDDERKDMFFELTEYAKVVSQDSALVAIEYGGYTYQGGAHGSSFTGFLNWDPKTKKALYLEDVLQPNTQKQLNKIGERIFRKNENLKDTASLEQDYFFEDAKFVLNENYLFTPVGIKFLYNEYEIKPYAAGQTELVIPWAELKTLLKPTSVVAHYLIKNAGI